MDESNQKTKPKFKTIDESIAHSKQFDPWFRFSAAIVSGGIVLGAISKLIYGRDFRPSDPWIGPFVEILAFIWLMSFCHLVYLMVKIRLSIFSRWFCRITFVIIAIILSKILVFDSIERQLQKKGEQAAPEQPLPSVQFR